jgi:putative transposase
MGGRRGFDGHQQVTGRKRPSLVDTEGFLLGVVVHPATVPDRAGGRRVLDAVGATFPRLQRIWADQGYTGSLQRWAARRYGCTLDVVYPHWRHRKRYAPDLVADLGYAPGFHVLPRRWVVERTVSWLGRCRRMSKDDERLATSAEAFIYLVGIRLLLARLTRSEK